ncbi:hypothetical protein PMAYCL1PPCAC_28695 [Pristionchus mayeri]|uniref:Uncharacterized protein n=1 Tax=Pristionchus mayeri TaxID=1317129 RepID=A0AAN5IBX6_9BILA|nr:hypothetical protein PMAYCL1PPCAC_28695 [Pristionchus mayeri]
MNSQHSVKLSDESKPRIIGEEMAKRIATVTRVAITVNITSSRYISRTITYTSDPKYFNWFDEQTKEWDEIPADVAKTHVCGGEPLIIKLDECDYGAEFTLHVIAKDLNTRTITENYQFSLRAELTKSEMDSFLRNILNRVNSSKIDPAYFYRNFTMEDEKRIMETNDGFFELTLKQKSGH